MKIVCSRLETRTARAPHRAFPDRSADIETRPVREVHQGEREKQQPQRPFDPAEKALDARGQGAPGVRLDAGAACSSRSR